MSPRPDRVLQIRLVQERGGASQAIAEFLNQGLATCDKASENPDGHHRGRIRRVRSGAAESVISPEGLCQIYDGVGVEDARRIRRASHINELTYVKPLKLPAATPVIKLEPFVVVPLMV